jgi:putative endonuclease
MLTQRNIKGRVAESYACAYLRRKGCKLHARNYRYKGGELDIVAKDKGGQWLFVEVKSVWEDSFGSPDIRVDKEKQRKIWQTALHFLHNNGGLEQNSRFDVATIDFSSENKALKYYENAFVASEVIPNLRIKRSKYGR